MSCEQHYYADDTQLYLSCPLNESHQAVAAINYDLENLFDYSSKSGLIVNFSKSMITVFGNKCDRLAFVEAYEGKIKICNKPLPFKSKVKNLGLFLDAELRFSHHINKCLQKAFINLKLIYHNRHILEKKTKSLLCEALVLSHLNFCDSIYGPCLTYYNALRVQKLQNSCLRLIYGIKKFDHISPTLQLNGWLNMKNRRYIHSACFHRNIILYKSPPYLFS